MKLVIASVAGCFVLICVLLFLGGMSPTSLQANIEVGTGMGAKLACSGKFITGQSPATIAEDLASYSAVLRLLDIEYDNSSTTASLFGLASTTATFRQGLWKWGKWGQVHLSDQSSVIADTASHVVRG